MDMRIPPLIIKILLESSPLKSRILVWRLAVREQLHWCRAVARSGGAHRSWGRLAQGPPGDSDEAEKKPGPGETGLGHLGRGAESEEAGGRRSSLAAAWLLS